MEPANATSERVLDASSVASSLRLELPENRFGNHSKLTTRRCLRVRWKRSCQNYNLIAACALRRETSRKPVEHNSSTRSPLFVDSSAQSDGFSFMFPRSSIPCPNGATLSELYRSRRDDLWGALTKEQLKV